MFFVVSLLVVLLSLEAVVCEPLSDTNYDWDILIFTQHWPVTVCYLWKKELDTNQCVFPTLRDIWTIHGIWPTKYGTIGPSFCNTTSKFDPDQISPMEQQLNIYWINIEKNTPLFSFWEHEWLKHGTCGMTLSNLNSEGKFFKQGLDWIGKYDMQTILQRGEIIPDKPEGYNVSEISTAIKTVLKTNPAVECIHDPVTNNWLINEIRICFNKSMDLIDCDGIRDPLVHVPGVDLITNCPLDKSVLYPSVVPGPQVHECRQYIVPWQLNFYRFLQFLIWLTL